MQDKNELIPYTNRAFKPRSLNEARASFSKEELDTLDMVLCQICKNEDASDQLTYEINMDEYKDKFGYTYSYNVYKKLKKNFVDTGAKTIQIWRGKNNFISFVLFQSVECDFENKKIIVKLSEEFKKELVKLKDSRDGGNTYYSIADTLMFKSQYTKRLYTMLLEWEKSGKRFDVFSELCDKLCIPKSYNNTMIKKRVFDAAVKEINELTDYKVSYIIKTEEHCGGAKATSIEWVIKKKKK